MFSRRKLFQMIGLGAAASVTARVLPAASAPSLNWTAEELAVLESTGWPVSSFKDGLTVQQAINRRRSEAVRQYIKFNKFGLYQPE